MSQDLELKVRVALIEKNMKHAELAEELNISRPYLSDLISGKRNGPKAKKHINKIREILSI